MHKGNRHTQTLKTDVDMFKMTNKTIKTWSNGYLVVCDFHSTFVCCHELAHISQVDLYESLCMYMGVQTRFLHHLR